MYKLFHLLFRRMRLFYIALPSVFAILAALPVTNGESSNIFVCYTKFDVIGARTFLTQKIIWTLT